MGLRLVDGLGVGRPDGSVGPYMRKVVVLTPGAQGRDSFGVKVAKIVQDGSAPRPVYDPGHADANDQGVVLYPNVDPLWEAVDALEATRAYEANVTAYELTKRVLAATSRLLA